MEKIWPLNYARRGGAYLSEGGGTMRNAYGNLAAPLNGYLWDSCARKNVTFRSYGEFAHWAPSTAADRAAGKVQAGFSRFRGSSARVGGSGASGRATSLDPRVAEEFLG